MQNEIELVNKIVERRAILDDLESRKKRENEEIELLENELYELMETKGVKSISSGEYSATAVKPKLSATVLKENKERLLQWVDDERGRPDLITRSVHPSSLSKFIADEVLGKGEEAPDFIELYFKKIIRINKKGAANDIEKE